MPDQIDLFGVQADAGQDSVAKQDTEQVVGDLAEPQIVSRCGWQQHAAADRQKHAGEQIHGGLVGYERVDVAAVMSTCKYQRHQDDAVGKGARHSGH